MVFAVPADHRVKLKENKSKKKSKYLNLAWELEKKTVEHENDVYTNCKWCSWYSHQMIDKETGGFGNNRTSEDHPNFCITEIDQNTVKGSGDFRKLAVTQAL